MRLCGVQTIQSAGWLLFLTAFTIGGRHSQAVEKSEPRFFVADFESSTGWKLGLLAKADSPVRLVQGSAKIIPLDEERSKQILELGPSELYPAVLVEASPLESSEEVFGEVLARPFAVDEKSSEEFFDFAGAVLAFVRVGDKGEIRALFGSTKTESLWISTGQRFALNDRGAAAQWLRLTVRLNRKTQRWDLSINGTASLAGLRPVRLASGRALRLWLYGHADHVSRFDDVILATADPDKLEQVTPTRAAGDERISAARRSADFAERSEKVVTRTKENSDIHQTLLNVAPTKENLPELRGWNVSLNTGAQTYSAMKPVLKDEPADTLHILAYAPGYDEAGNRLPATITITADAELAPGVDLSRLRWDVVEALGIQPSKYGATIGEGDFRTGLVQTFTMPAEWTKKATSVRVWVEKPSLRLQIDRPASLMN